MKMSPYYRERLPSAHCNYYWKSQSTGRRTHLCAAVEEKLVWVDAIADSAANKGKPVKDHWGLMRLLEQQLAQDIDHDGEGDEEQRADQGESPDGLSRAMLAELVDETGEQAHGDRLGGVEWS